MEAVNIGERERTVRGVLGYAFLAFGAAVTVALVFSDANPWWSLVLLPLFYQGARFRFDKRSGTCPLKAELGQHRLDGVLTILGQRIDDAATVSRIKTISRRGLVEAAVWGVVLTAAAAVLVASVR